MSGWKSWAIGEVVEATDFQGYVQDQVVQVYANSTARGSALGTAVTEGMVSYLQDTNLIEVYDGSSWINFTGDITGVTAGTALTGGGTSGNVTLNVNLGAVTIPASQISDLTATAAELNILDGATVTTAELNTLDGITATTTELNYTDGVTSNIQTQLDARMPIGGELGTEDLNTVTTTGLYYQSQNADAAAASNYPTPYAGHLIVTQQGALTFQTYYVYAQQGPAVFHRSYYSSWTSWVPLINAKFDSTSSNNTLVSTQYGKTIRLTGTTGRTFTLNSGMPAGVRVDYIQDGTGVITFAAGAGVTLKSKGGKLSTGGQYSAVSVIAYSTTEYYLIGDLA